MAHIVSSQEAPTDEAVSYSFASGDFTLDVGGRYESDDRELLGSAEGHPWLEVEYDEADLPVARYRAYSLAPEDDALSAKSSVAFDPEQVEADLPDAVDASPPSVSKPIRPSTRTSTSDEPKTKASIFGSSPDDVEDKS